MTLPGRCYRDRSAKFPNINFSTPCLFLKSVEQESVHSGRRLYKQGQQYQIKSCRVRGLRGYSAPCPKFQHPVTFRYLISCWVSSMQAKCAWPPVNCACVSQLFQLIINTTLFQLFWGNSFFICCVPLQIQTFIIILSIFFHICWIPAKKLNFNFPRYCATCLRWGG